MRCVITFCESEFNYSFIHITLINMTVGLMTDDLWGVRNGIEGGLGVWAFGTSLCETQCKRCFISHWFFVFITPIELVHCNGLTH